MSVNVNLYLPPDVEPRHLADFFAIKLGAEPMIQSMEYGGFTVDLHVDLVKAENSPIVGMEYLNWKGSKAYDKYILSHPFQPSFHYGTTVPEHMYKRVPPEMKKRFGKVWTEVMSASSPQKVALYRAAAKFFGGVLVPVDADWEKFEVYKRTMPVNGRGLMPDDDPSWSRYQMAMYWVQPLTKEDIENAWKDSGYKSEETPVKDYPISRQDLPGIAEQRQFRLDNFKAGGSRQMDAIAASRAVKRKLKAGPGMGWWGQPVRHKMAAKKGHANKRR